MPKSLRLKEISVTAIFNSPKDAYSALVLFTSQQQIRIDDWGFSHTYIHSNFFSSNERIINGA